MLREYIPNEGAIEIVLNFEQIEIAGVLPLNLCECHLARDNCRPKGGNVVSQRKRVGRAVDGCDLDALLAEKGNDIVAAARAANSSTENTGKRICDHGGEGLAVDDCV